MTRYPLIVGPELGHRMRKTRYAMLPLHSQSIEQVGEDGGRMSGSHHLSSSRAIVGCCATVFPKKSSHRVDERKEEGQGEMGRQYCYPPLLDSVYSGFLPRPAFIFSFFFDGFLSAGTLGFGARMHTTYDA